MWRCGGPGAFSSLVFLLLFPFFALYWVEWSFRRTSCVCAESAEATSCLDGYAGWSLNLTLEFCGRPLHLAGWFCALLMSSNHALCIFQVYIWWSLVFAISIFPMALLRWGLVSAFLLNSIWNLLFNRLSLTEFNRSHSHFLTSVLVDQIRLCKTDESRFKFASWYLCRLALQITIFQNWLSIQVVPPRQCLASWDVEYFLDTQTLFAKQSFRSEVCFSSPCFRFLDWLDSPIDKFFFSVPFPLCNDWFSRRRGGRRNLAYCVYILAFSGSPSTLCWHDFVEASHPPNWPFLFFPPNPSSLYDHEMYEAAHNTVRSSTRGTLSSSSQITDNV